MPSEQEKGFDLMDRVTEGIYRMAETRHPASYLRDLRDSVTLATAGGVEPIRRGRTRRNLRLPK